MPFPLFAELYRAAWQGHILTLSHLPLTPSTGTHTHSVCLRTGAVCDSHLGLSSWLPQPHAGPPAAQGDPAICFRRKHLLSLCPFSKTQGWLPLFFGEQNTQNWELATRSPCGELCTCGTRRSSRSPDGPQGPRPSPGPGVAAELVHVGVVLGQDGDGVTLLPDDEPCLLLCGAP